MSAKQSSESQDESPSSFLDPGAFASLLEQAGVGYDRSDDRPFSLRPPAIEMIDETDLQVNTLRELELIDPQMNTLREPDLFDFSDPDTEVEFLDDGRPTDRPPPPDFAGDPERTAAGRASDDGPDLTDPGGLPAA